MIFFTEPINLVVEEISQNKPAVQTPIKYISNQKEKHVSIRYYSILILMKSGLAHHFSALIQFPWFILMWNIFSSLSPYLLWEKCYKNCTYNDGTFLWKEGNFLSVQHYLKFNCVKMSVFETLFKIFNSCFFLYPTYRDEK